MPSPGTAFIFATLLVAGCSHQAARPAPDSAELERPQTAAAGAFAELEGGGAVPLPGSTPTEAEGIFLKGGKALADPPRIPQPDYKASPGWFLVDTTLVFPATTAPRQARQTTLQAARTAGLERALPPEVSMTSLLSDVMDETMGAAYEKSTWSTFALSSVVGHVVDEKILSEELLPLESGVYRYRIALEARVVPVVGDRDPSLGLELTVNERLLADGDELIIRARASQPGYIYLFNFLGDNSVTLLFPNRIMTEGKLEANRWLEIPTSQERARGIRYRVAADPDLATTTETLFALFSRQPIAELGSLISVEANYVKFSAGDASFTRFQRWLSKIPLSQRVEKALQLHIVSATNQR